MCDSVLHPSAAPFRVRRDLVGPFDMRSGHWPTCDLEVSAMSAHRETLRQSSAYSLHCGLSAQPRHPTVQAIAQATVCTAIQLSGAGVCHTR